MTGSVQGDARTTVVGADPGEQHAHDLADKIRLLAATDPQLARDLVAQLVAALDRATDGAFRDQLYAAGTPGAGPAAGPSAAAERDGRAYSSPVTS